MRRVAVIVLDACGVGALPDAAAYGDAGANTLGHLAERVGGLELPTLTRLGLGSILPLRPVRSCMVVWRRWGQVRSRRPVTGSSWGWCPHPCPPTQPAFRRR